MVWALKNKSPPAKLSAKKIYRYTNAPTGGLRSSFGAFFV
jgi:hypothetical protein